MRRSGQRPASHEKSAWITLKRRACTMIVPIFLLGAPTSWAQDFSWDATWVGGWEDGAGTQIIVAGGEVIGFLWNDDYQPVLRSSTSDDGTMTFSWASGEAALSPVDADSASVTILEQGSAERTIALERE